MCSLEFKNPEPVLKRQVQQQGISVVQPWRQEQENPGALWQPIQLYWGSCRLSERPCLEIKLGSIHQDTWHWPLAFTLTSACAPSHIHTNEHVNTHTNVPKSEKQKFHPIAVFCHIKQGEKNHLCNKVHLGLFYVICLCWIKQRNFPCALLYGKPSVQRPRLLYTRTIQKL